METNLSQKLIRAESNVRRLRDLANYLPGYTHQDIVRGVADDLYDLVVTVHSMGVADDEQ